VIKVLIILSGNSKNVAPFVSEQVSLLENEGVSFSYYFIEGNGVIGYLSNLKRLSAYIIETKPDVIHAHYGLSGLLANMQRKVPVITTFHGSDINQKKNLFFSKWASKLSAYSIFVSVKLVNIAKVKQRFSVIPCGVDTTLFREMSEELTRNSNDEIEILFSSSFSRKVKNSGLAINAVKLAESRLKRPIKLIELDGFTRAEVAILLNRVNLALLTSFSEGSPQFIKEALATNCPIVSTNVGDIEMLLEDVEGCYITTFAEDDVCDKIIEAIDYSQNKIRTSGRKRIVELGLENSTIVKSILQIYENCTAKVKVVADS